MLSYRKDDRAMLPIYGCPENFLESLVAFPEIFNGLLSRSILWMCVQNLKFVASYPFLRNKIAIEILDGVVIKLVKRLGKTATANEGS